MCILFRNFLIEAFYFMCCGICMCVYVLYLPLAERFSIDRVQGLREGPPVHKGITLSNLKALTVENVTHSLIHSR